MACSLVRHLPGIAGWRNADDRRSGNRMCHRPARRVHRLHRHQRHAESRSEVRLEQDVERTDRSRYQCDGDFRRESVGGVVIKASRDERCDLQLYQRAHDDPYCTDCALHCRHHRSDVRGFGFGSDESPSAWRGTDIHRL